MRRNLNSRLIALLLVGAAVAGCSKKEAPPPPPEAKKPAQPAKPATPPVQKQLSSVAQPGGKLDFSKRNDPFKPYAPAAPPPPAATAQGAGVPAREGIPLQSFEVSKFKVVGIIAGMNENRALVVDPNGKGYVVQVGMQIGNLNGRIVKITASSVEVVERFKEGSGRMKQRTTVLTLAKKR